MDEGEDDEKPGYSSLNAFCSPDKLVRKDTKLSQHRPSADDPTVGDAE